jgi:eukaryotic-like serine/threonine-protein kinase
VGRYLVHHEIASGGMASVHLGKLCGPVGFSPIVAIKSMHAHYAKDPEFVRMFQDEARLAGRIRHRNIVPVLDVHAEEGELFLVLEYIHGESLSRLMDASLRHGDSIRPAVASAIMCDVLHGLHAAHEAKGEHGEALEIVHRDVSPQNIMVGVDGAGRVLDFGVAKATGRMQTTQDGQVKGKFAYMAPEQLRGDKVNRQADVYSAAVVLWEILTCQRLFSAESEGNTVEKVLFAQVSAPSAMRGDVSRALDGVVMRGLARARSDRFSSAKEMALALQAAEPPAPPSEVGEWVEACAIDALEKRARLVAEVESSSVPATADVEIESPPAGPGDTEDLETLPIPIPVTVEEGTSAGQSVPGATPRDPGSSERSRATRRRVLLTSIVSLVGAGLVFSLYVRATSTPSTPPVEPETLAVTTAPPTAPGPSVPSSDSVVLPAALPPAIIDAGSSVRAKTPPTVRRPAGGNTPSAGTARPPAAAPTVRCARHNADGVITFDEECLRGAQRGP